MARAKRHYLHGHVWHITHRYHKKEFLLKLVKDRQRWLYWLFQAKKRYGFIAGIIKSRDCRKDMPQ
jgi:putative transposase